MSCMSPYSMPLWTIFTKWPAPSGPQCVTHGPLSVLAAIDSTPGFSPSPAPVVPPRMTRGAERGHERGGGLRAREGPALVVGQELVGHRLLEVPRGDREAVIVDVEGEVAAHDGEADDAEVRLCLSRHGWAPLYVLKRVQP